MPHDSEPHAQHDLLLVVSLAAGDITAAERDRATSLIADCAACETLHDDLLAIARATATLPAAPRPRDFQLTPEQAARLRPGGWRRFVAAFASPRLAMTRQLGVGLTTLGLAGLLVSVLPTVNLGMGGGAAGPATEQVFSGADESSDNGLQAAPAGAAPSAAAASAAPVQVVGEASASQDRAVNRDATSVQPSSGRTNAGVYQATQPSATDVAIPAPAERAVPDGSPIEGSGVSLLLVASAILLAAGIALLLARRIARGVTGG
jgi:hypothetical protein